MDNLKSVNSQREQERYWASTSCPPAERKPEGSEETLMAAHRILPYHLLLALASALSVLGASGQGRAQLPAAPTQSGGQASGTLPAHTQLTRDVLGRTAAAVYESVWRALVRVEDENGEVKMNPCESGVIITGQGHILCRAFAGESKLCFRLHDGRRATATTLGWSSEWSVGLAKLDGPGPWPHVELHSSKAERQ